MKVFPDYSRDLFNTILEEENLKFDRDGRRRTAYSLRQRRWRPNGRGAVLDRDDFLSLTTA